MADISEEVIEAAVCSLEEVDSVKTFSKYDSGAARDTFRVEASNRKVFVLYICSDTSEEYERRFSKEEKVLELVNEKTDIPTQKILKSDFSKDTVSYLFYIAEEIEGFDPMSRYKYLPRDDKKKIVYQAGIYLGKLHRELSFESAGELYNKQGRINAEGLTWEQYLENWSEKYIENFYGTPFSDLKEKAYEFVERYSELAEIDENVCLHFDIKPDNLIIKDGEINAVIDWEKAISGAPEWDLAYARVQMMYRWFETQEINEDLERELFRGYFKENELDNGWRERLIYCATIWGYRSMAHIHRDTEGMNEEEKKEEVEFFRDFFQKRFEGLEEVADKEISFPEDGR